MIPVKEIYEAIKTLQHKITWQRGRVTTCEARIKRYEARKSRAKSYDKEVWDEKIKWACLELENARNELFKAIQLLKEYLNGQREI